MSLATTKAAFDAYKRAAETKDERALLALYADDAEVIDVNKRNPPAAPSRLSGKGAIGAWVSGVPKELAHTVSDEVIGDDRMAFTYRCRYPNGQQVFGVHVCELREGKIARETFAEAWDE